MLALWFFVVNNTADMLTTVANGFDNELNPLAVWFGLAGWLGIKLAVSIVAVYAAVKVLPRLSPVWTAAMTAFLWTGGFICLLAALNNLQVALALAEWSHGG